MGERRTGHAAGAAARGAGSTRSADSVQPREKLAPAADKAEAPQSDGEVTIDLDDLDLTEGTGPAGAADMPPGNVTRTRSALDHPATGLAVTSNRPIATRPSPETIDTRPSSLTDEPRMVLQALAILATLACGVALLAFQLRSSGSNRAPATTNPPNTSQALAERWVLTNTSDAHVLVDKQVRQHLMNSGVSAARLVTYDRDGRLVESNSTPVPVTGFLVLASAPRSHQSGVLAGLISDSAVVAQFGSGQQQVQVRQIVPGGMAASLPARSAAKKFRETAGVELLANHAVTTSKAAAQALAAGQVDSSLLSLLAALALTHHFTISGFPAVAGESSTSEVRRTAELVAIDGEPIRPGGTAVSQVMGFFQSQVADFHPSQIHLTTRPTPVLTVVFPLPALPA